MYAAHVRWMFVPFLAALFIFLPGCDGDNNDETPTVIPAAAFALRTSLFDTARPGAGEHFGAAVDRLQPVSEGFRAHLDLALAVAIACEQLTPSPEGDNFVWRGTADFNGVDVGFELTATPANADIVDWFMDVSFDDGTVAVQDFQVVRARSLTNATLGEWNHYAMIDGVRSLIFRAQYGAVGQDRFVGVAVEDSARIAIAADSLEYSEYPNNIREVLWFDGDSDDAFFIQWDEGSNAGWLVATDYNESAQSCWDDSLADADCPE